MQKMNGIFTSGTPLTYFIQKQRSETQKHILCEPAPYIPGLIWVMRVLLPGSLSALLPCSGETVWRSLQETEVPMHCAFNSSFFSSSAIQGGASEPF